MRLLFEDKVRNKERERKSRGKLIKKKVEEEHELEDQQAA
jgi:hypothetical protein